MKTVEEWADIPGWEGRYQVSSHGRIKSIKRNIMLKQVANEKGYMRVCLWDGQRRSNETVHRMVAMAFVGNPNNYPQVNHIDENKQNNHADNFEWCTNQYNVEYSESKEYDFKSPDGEKVTIFNLNKFCRDSGLDNGNMHSVYRGRAISHKGWTKWEGE